MRYFTLIICLFAANLLRAQNTKPVILGPDTKQTCAGTEACFYFTTADGDHDSVYVFWDMGVPGAFSNNNGAARFASGSVCWTPANADTADTARQFTIYATDHRDTVSRVFSLFVRGTPSLTTTINNVGCNDFSVQMVPGNGVPFSTSTIAVYDTANKLKYMSSALSDTVKLPGGRGTYRFFTIISTDFSCYADQEDMITASKGVGLRIDADMDLSFQVKEWSELHLSAVVTDSNGYSSIQYNWIPGGPATAGVTVFPTMDTVYRVIAKTPDQCESPASAEVKVFLTGIDKTAAQKIRVYPNPATAYLSVEKTNENITTAEIWTISGQKIMQAALGANISTLDISGIKTGSYILVFTDNTAKPLAHTILVKE